MRPTQRPVSTRSRPRHRHRVDLDDSEEEDLGEDAALAEVGEVLDLLNNQHLGEPPPNDNFSPSNNVTPAPLVRPIDLSSDNHSSSSSSVAETPAPSDICDFDILEFPPVLEHLVDIHPLIHDLDILVANLPEPPAPVFDVRPPRVFSGPPLNLPGHVLEQAEVDAWEDPGAPAPDCPSVVPRVCFSSVDFAAPSPTFTHAAHPVTLDPEAGPFSRRIASGGPRPFLRVRTSVGRRINLSDEASAYLQHFVSALAAAG